MMDDDAGSDGDVEGMFSTILGNLKAAVAEVDNFLVNTLDLIAKDDGIMFTWERFELMEHSAAFSLFYRQHVITFLLQLTDSLDGGRKIGPVDAIFGTKSRLVNFGMRGSASDATEQDALYTEGIAGT